MRICLFKISKSFYIQGFSLGGFIILNYLAKYHNNGCTCCPSGHAIPKVVFQSPWHGNIPIVLKGLILVPGLLRLFKPSDMDSIRSIKALKQILLRIDKQDKFHTRLKDFASIIQTLGSNEITNNTICSTCENILFLAGTREPFFYWTAKRMWKTATAAAKDSTEKRYRYKLCKYADHMTFVKDYDGYVGDFYRKTLEEFYGEVNTTAVVNDDVQVQLIA